jgi:hypothetical protein
MELANRNGINLGNRQRTVVLAYVPQSQSRQRDVTYCGTSARFTSIVATAITVTVFSLGVKPS